MIILFFFFSSFCCCSVFFNDAGCRAWTTSFPSECFQRTYQRLCYYLSPSFPWLTRAHSGLLNRRKRRGGCCLALSLHMARHWNGEAGQTSRRTEDRLPAPPSAWSGHAEYSSTDHAGPAETASLAWPSWSETASVIAVEQEWICLLLYSSERKRPDLPSGLNPTPKAWISCFHSEEMEAKTQESPLKQGSDQSLLPHHPQEQKVTF